MKIAIGCDHAGIILKDCVIKCVEGLGHPAVYMGCPDASSCHYPIYGRAVAKAVRSGECDLGILMCGTGIGISIAANKVKGIRCALVTNEFMAEMARRHNDANVLAMGGRVLSPEEAVRFADIWLDSEFEGGRHQRRVDQLNAL